MARMADQEPHVVVTIADNGIVHAWGDGPVVGGAVKPFANRAAARRAADAFKRDERKLAEEDPSAFRVQVTVKVCKVLGVDPVEVKTTT